VAQATHQFGPESSVRRGCLVQKDLAIEFLVTPTERADGLEHRVEETLDLERRTRDLGAKGRLKKMDDCQWHDLKRRARDVPKPASSH
jgi:hypothetical protein